MKGFNKKKLPEYLSDFEIELTGETTQTAAQTAANEIIKKEKRALNQISRDLIEKLAYYNHLKYPGNSELDNWNLAVDEYNNK